MTQIYQSYDSVERTLEDIIAAMNGLLDSSNVLEVGAGGEINSTVEHGTNFWAYKIG